MKTVHFFAFYLHNLPKITDFSPWSSMNPKTQYLYILMGMGGGALPHFQFSDVQSVFFRCTINPLQISTSASLSFYSCFYDDLLLLLGWFIPAFRMIYSWFYDALLLLLGCFTPAFRIRWFNIAWTAMDIALILFLPLIAMLSCREYKIFRPGK